MESKLNYYSVKRPIISKKVSSIKKTIKYLSICQDPRIQRRILRISPNPIIKSICNAALNIERGPLQLTKTHKKLLSNNRPQIHTIANSGNTISQKRKILIQGGNGILAILPLILSTVLSSLGSTFMSYKSK